MSDLISRQAAIAEIEKHTRLAQEPYLLSEFEKGLNWGLDTAISITENLPSAERKTGRWIWDDEGYHCSECFFHAYGNTLECMNGQYRYCPNCGCKMEVEPDAPRHGSMTTDDCITGPI